MKVLYAAYLHDPTDPNLSSGADFNFYSAIRKSGYETEVILPNLPNTHLVERALQRVHRKLLKKRYAKFPISKLKAASGAVNGAAARFKPDVVFGMFPPSSCYYSAPPPYVHRLDTTFWGWQQEYPEFSRLGLMISMWQERHTFANASRIITHSVWTRDILIDKYRVPAEKIVRFPNPARLLYDADQSLGDGQKELTYPIQLLFVGKDYVRKNLAGAIEIVQLLNDSGLPAELIVCGPRKIPQQPHVRYAGFFKKSDPEQYAQYLTLYRKAHILLHPARFDPSPIVTSEAAAFGTPTITNANGGLPTSVKHGVSGIVLPHWITAQAYVLEIQQLAQDPPRYQLLSRQAKLRFERELNWRVAGRKLMEVLESVVEKHH